MVVRMPNAWAAATLVVSATKCRAVSVPPCASNHALAECALVMVSIVVTVLLAIRNSVLSGLMRLNTAASSCHVHVGDKVKTLAWQHKLIERQQRHLRTQI